MTNMHRDKVEAINTINAIHTRIGAITSYTDKLNDDLTDDTLAWSRVLVEVEALYHALDPAIKLVRSNDR